MPLDVAATKDSLAEAQLRDLFIQQLGWNRSTVGSEITMARGRFVLSGVAEACGALALEVSPAPGGAIPPIRVRNEIIRKVRKSHVGHLLIFVNSQRSEMLWQPSISQAEAVAPHRCFSADVGEGLLGILRELRLWEVPGREWSHDLVTSRVLHAFRPDRLDCYAARPDGRQAPAAPPRAAWPEGYRLRYSIDSIAISDMYEADYEVIAATKGSPLAEVVHTEPLETVRSPVNRRTSRRSDGFVHADLLAGNSTHDAFETAAETSLREQLAEIMATLNPRERRIVELRCGLVNDRAWTLAQVGDDLSITRERVRQIEGKALRKLRREAFHRKLHDFLTGAEPLPSPWSLFWARLRTAISDEDPTPAERALHEFQSEEPPEGGWTPVQKQFRDARWRHLVHQRDWERALSRRQAQAVTAVLRGATGSIKLTDVAPAAIADYSWTMVAHRPPQPISIAPTAPGPGWRRPTAGETLAAHRELTELRKRVPSGIGNPISLNDDFVVRNSTGGADSGAVMAHLRRVSHDKLTVSNPALAAEE